MLVSTRGSDRSVPRRRTPGLRSLLLLMSIITGTWSAALMLTRTAASASASASAIAPMGNRCALALRTRASQSTMRLEGRHSPAARLAQDTFLVVWQERRPAARVRVLVADHCRRTGNEAYGALTRRAGNRGVARVFPLPPRGVCCLGIQPSRRSQRSRRGYALGARSTPPSGFQYWTRQPATAKARPRMPHRHATSRTCSCHAVDPRPPPRRHHQRAGTSGPCGAPVSEQAAVWPSRGVSAPDQPRGSSE